MTTDRELLECDDCDHAATQPWHGFRANCPGCAARAVARGVNYASSRSRGQQTRQYREELALLHVTHQQVLEASRVDHINTPAGG